MEISEPLPKWMMRKYALLWQKFGDKQFTLKECVEEIKEDEKILMVLFSRLRKMGWLDVEQDEQDGRRRLYALRPAQEVIARMTA